MGRRDALMQELREKVLCRLLGQRLVESQGEQQLHPERLKLTDLDSEWRQTKGFISAPEKGPRVRLECQDTKLP